MERIISIFSSSEPIEGDKEYEIAYQVGYELAKAGYAICNGSYEGTMEASAKGAKNAGGRTYGVTTAQYSPRKVNPYIDEEIKTNYALERLETLIRKGNGYVVLKGSTGTLAELATTWEWINKKIIPIRPIVLYNKFWLPTINSLMSKKTENNDEKTRKKRKKIIDCVKVATNAKEVVALLNKFFTESQKA